MINFFLKKKIISELKDPYPLPLGRKEFEEWSDKIIKAAQVPGATEESLKFALAEMVLHTKPNESFVPLAHFVHTLRKGAANQVAHAIFTELKQQRNARENEEKIKVVEPTRLHSTSKEVVPKTT